MMFEWGLSLPSCSSACVPQGALQQTMPPLVCMVPCIQPDQVGAAVPQELQMGWSMPYYAMSSGCQQVTVPMWNVPSGSVVWSDSQAFPLDAPVEPLVLSRQCEAPVSATAPASSQLSAMAGPLKRPPSAWTPACLMERKRKNGCLGDISLVGRSISSHSRSTINALSLETSSLHLESNVRRHKVDSQTVALQRGWCHAAQGTADKPACMQPILRAAPPASTDLGGLCTEPIYTMPTWEPGPAETWLSIADSSVVDELATLERTVDAACQAPMFALAQQGRARPHARNHQTPYANAVVQARRSSTRGQSNKPRPHLRVGPCSAEQKKHMEEEEKEVPILAAHEFPSLGSLTGKPRKGPPPTCGGLQKVAELRVPIGSEPLAAPATKARSMEGTAWGVRANEARKAAAAKREAPTVPNVAVDVAQLSVQRGTTAGSVEQKDQRGEASSGETLRATKECCVEQSLVGKNKRGSSPAQTEVKASTSKEGGEEPEEKDEDGEEDSAAEVKVSERVCFDHNPEREDGIQSDEAILCVNTNIAQAWELESLCMLPTWTHDDAIQDVVEDEGDADDEGDTAGNDHEECEEDVEDEEDEEDAESEQDEEDENDESEQAEEAKDEGDKENKGKEQGVPEVQYLKLDAQSEASTMTAELAESSADEETHCARTASQSLSPSLSEVERLVNQSCLSQRCSYSDRGHVSAQPPTLHQVSLATSCNADRRQFPGFLLAYRFLEVSPPDEIATLVAREDASAWKQARVAVASEGDAKRAAASMPSDRAMFGTKIVKEKGFGGRAEREQPSTSNFGALHQTAIGYKRLSTASGAISREQQLKRCVRSLLNKICPESVHKIAARIKEESKVQSVGELQLVIGLVFRKALAEPHYCESYADLVHHLKTEMPEFLLEGEVKPVTFKSALINVCQDEFENMPRTLAPTPEEATQCDADELQFKQGQQKARFLANMKFIGHLFLRELLPTKIIASVIQDLMMVESADAPEEHVVECICEVLNAIGYTLEQKPVGKATIVQVCGRMLDLKQRKTNEGKGVYSKRIQFAIQDILDTRKAGWTKKVFKIAARTKEEIRLEQERQIREQTAGKDVSVAEVVVAGQRPAYLGDIHTKRTNADVDQKAAQVVVPECTKPKTRCR